MACRDQKHRCVFPRKVTKNVHTLGASPPPLSFVLGDTFLNVTQIGTSVDVVTQDDDDEFLLGFELTNEYIAADFDPDSPFVATSNCYTGEASTYNCQVEVIVPNALDIQASCVYTEVFLSGGTEFFAIAYSTGETLYANNSAENFENLRLGMRVCVCWCLRFRPSNSKGLVTIPT